MIQYVMMYLESRIMNNTDLNTGPLPHQVPSMHFQVFKIGGACLFQGRTLYVNSSYFKDNCGFLGGALMIEANIDPQSIFIENSIFEANYAIYGASIGFSFKIRHASTILRNNYFKSNAGISMFLYFFFYKNEIY